MLELGPEGETGTSLCYLLFRSRNSQHFGDVRGFPGLGGEAGSRTNPSPSLIEGRGVRVGLLNQTALTREVRSSK